MEEDRRLDPPEFTDPPSSSRTRVSSEVAQSCLPWRRSPRPFSRDRTPLSRFLNLGVRPQPRQQPVQRTSELCTGVSESEHSDKTQQETESPFRSVATESLVPSLSYFPASTVLPSFRVVVTSPTTSTPNSSPPPKPPSFPEGPPSQSPYPPEWQYSEPSEESSLRASILIKSASSSPLHTPSSSQPQDISNPSYSVDHSLASRRSLLPQLSNFGRHRSRSPLLGIAALNSKSNPVSQLSLDWDNYGSSPTYFRRVIPVVSTPSTSLESSPEKLGTPVSVIMTVRRCSKCHFYISGAPSPELEHVGAFGPSCEAQHHPNPCDYNHRDNGPCTEYSTLAPDTSDHQAKFGQHGLPSVASSEAVGDSTHDSKQLMLEMSKVDTLIRMFPAELMTMDRLNSYEQELKDIRNQFLAFATKVVTFAISHVNSVDSLKTGDGTPMNVEFWQSEEQKLGQRMTDHQILIRKAASDIQSQKSMTEFEREEIVIKREELKLKKEQIELMKKSQSKTEEGEKAKANAVAMSKYDEIMLISTEFDDFLDKVPDWTKASRAEVMTGMKNLEKWGQKFNELNKAHREFVLATSTYMLPNESDKVEEILEDTTSRYKEVTRAIEEEDKKRELYSLAGSNKEQVKLPGFGGIAGEDFSTFKAKLLLAFEKNMIPASDKVEKLRACLSGAALALVPEKTHDFNKALEVLRDAYGNPERVLAVRLSDIKKLGKCPPEVVNGRRNFNAIVSFCLKAEVLLQDLLDLAEQEGCEQLQHDVYSSSVRASIQRLFSLKEEKKMRSFTARGKAGLEEHLEFIKELRSKSQTMVDAVSDPKERPGRRDDDGTEREPKKNTGHNMFKQPKRISNCRICKVLESDGSTGLFNNHISENVMGCPKFQAMTAEERRNISIRAKLCMKCCDPKVIFDARHRRDCKVTKNNKIPITCAEHPDCLMHSWLCGYHQDSNQSKITEFSKRFKIQPPVNTNTASVASNASVDTARVLKNMKRNLKKRGAALIPIPEGDSMFVLAPLKGINKPVLGFFDSGCSDAVARHGIPGVELNGICVNEGPITCFGVGATKVEAKQEWIIKLKRKDGNYQLVQTLTMDTVCAPMPVVNTGEAVSQLKNSDISNSTLQNCSVPSQVGGNVDLILGIR